MRDDAAEPSPCRSRRQKQTGIFRNLIMMKHVGWIYCIRSCFGHLGSLFGAQRSSLLQPAPYLEAPQLNQCTTGFLQVEAGVLPMAPVTVSFNSAPWSNCHHDSASPLGGIAVHDWGILTTPTQSGGCYHLSRHTARRFHLMANI